MTRLLSLGDFKRASGISAATARAYLDAGWIPGTVDSSGRRLFSPEAVDIARRIRSERARGRARR